MLESALYQDNAFATLTYDEENNDGSLHPEHLRNFWKRFRKSVHPLRVRYFSVGEYGDQTQRPHYHAAIFNYPSCRNGMSRYDLRRVSCCPPCDQILESWGYGRVFVGSLELHSAQYIAGYVCKKMTSKNDPRLDGRYPEFSRQSNRPGIGHDFMFDVASTLMQFNLDTSQPDVPSALRHGKKELPLGRYLRRKLRTMVGKDEKTPQAIVDALNAEMLPLRVMAKNSSENPSLKDQIVLANKGAVAGMESRHRIFKKRGSI